MLLKHGDISTQMTTDKMFDLDIQCYTKRKFIMEARVHDDSIF